MKFRTEYDARPAGTLIDPKQPVVLLGSCFTDNIGQRMRFCRWEAFPNITGTLYNPSSIVKILNIACNSDAVSEAVADSIATNGKLWMSWLADSGCTTFSKNDTEQQVLDRLLLLRKNLADTHTLIITFGTAWIYELRERPGYVVTNCHKFPAETFVRRRLSISEIAEAWSNTLHMLSEKYPDLRVIFTVSPVRHMKDGMEGNSRSKAILQLACEEICHENVNAEYFPAFEILNDDLRDYRFYASDLTHPSEQAVEYIWQKFQERYLSKSSRELLALGEKETKRLLHRPIIANPNTPSGDE